MQQPAARIGLEGSSSGFVPGFDACLSLITSYRITTRTACADLFPGLMVVVCDQ